MKCEICGVQPATMWVEPRTTDGNEAKLPVVSCDDCGPQAGYKILAPLEPSATR